MANKKIPLKKPNGSNGDGNIKSPGGPLVLDLGEFDDIFGPSEAESPKSGPLGEFWQGLKDSFSSRTQTKDLVRNFLRSAAPDGISNLMGFADEAMSASRDIKDSLERTNASDLQYIAKKAQELLPKLQEYAPDGMYNSISQGLEDKIDEYDYTIQSQRDQTAIRRAAADQKQDDEIKAALDNVALTERLNHNRSEQAANYRHSQDRAEQGIRDVLDAKRFDYVSQAMGITADSTQRLANYNEQVGYGFQRKGLELQFRSYLGIKELIKLQEASIELAGRGYSSLIRNTGLSDYDKKGKDGLTDMEQKGRPSLLGRAARSATSKTLSNFLGTYGGQVQDRVTNTLSDQLRNMVMMARMGENTPDLWDNKYNLLGQGVGEVLGGYVTNDILPTIGRMARPKLTSLSDKHAGGIHNKIGYGLDNIPAMMQEFVNNSQNQYGIKGKIRDFISPLVPQFGLNDRLQDGTFQTIDQPAQFNQGTQRTIVDGIPGYLARLLQEVRMIRTGSDAVGREVFDLTTGTFRLESTAHASLLDRIVPKSAIKSASSTINDTLNQMDEDGELSPEARKALSERLLRDGSTNRRFDPEAYIKARGYDANTSPEVAKELEAFFSKKFEMDDKGKMVDNAANQKLRQEFSQAFLDIRSVSKDPIKEIERMVSSGNTEPLRAMGIITAVDNVDKINYPRIWEILRGNVTDTNPYAPEGDGFDPNREDRSGDVNHRDFVGPVFPGAEKAWVKNKVRKTREKYAPQEQELREAAGRHVEAAKARFGKAAEEVKAHAPEIKERATELATTARSKASDLVARARGKVPGAMDQAKEITDTLKANVPKILGDFRNRAQDMAQRVGLSDVQAKAQDLIDKTKAALPELQAKTRGFIEQTKDNLPAVVDAVKQKANPVTDRIKDNVPALLDDAKRKAEDLVKKAQDQASTILDQAKETAPDVLEEAKQQAEKMLADAKAESSRLMKEAVEKTEELTKQARSKGDAIREALTNGAPDVSAYGAKLKSGYAIASNDLLQGLATAHGKFVGNTLPTNDTATDIDLSKRGYTPNGMEKLTDLYSKFDPTQPVIKGVDFTNGSLIDVNTRKIITRPEDITGEVINRQGQTVLTGATELVNPDGEVVVKAKDDAHHIITQAVSNSRFGGTAKQVEEPTPEEGDSDAEDQLNAQDWSLGPGEEPILTGRGFDTGKYYDAAGKVLRSIKDISGDVYDKSGNLLMSAKEFGNGLWSSRTGKRYRPKGALAKLIKLGKSASRYSGKTAGALAWGATKFTAKAALGIASKAFNFIIDNQNAYLPDQPVPVLTRRSLLNGEYYDADGKVVEDFVDVYTVIYNVQGEPVVAPELYPKLTNYDGTKHVLAKNKSIWGKFVMRPLRAVRDAYMRKTKQYYKWLGKTAVNTTQKVGGKLLGGFAKAGQTILDRSFHKLPEQQQDVAEATAMGVRAGNKEQTELLQDIAQTLKDSAPEKIRKGSWQDQQKRKAEDASKDGDTDAEEQEKKDGFMKRGLKGLAAMLGFGKKKEEEEDDGFGLDDAADIADIGDSIGDARERRRTRKAAKAAKKAGGKTGKIASMVKKVADSRLGKLASKIPGAGLLGRGAMMAGTALAGMVSAPVLIGAAALAATAGVGVFAYTRNKNISGEFRELRLAQYGVNEPAKKGFINSIMDMDIVSFGGDKIKVLDLESLLEGFTSKSSENPSLNLSGAGGTQMLEIMGIDPEDQRAVASFASWLDKRFKPVFLAWIKGLKKVGKSDVKINEIDDKLPNELKGDFLQTIRFPYTGDTPYAFTSNPFEPDYPLEDNTKLIGELFDKLEAKYKVEDQKAKDDSKTASQETPTKKEGSTNTTAKVAGAATVAGGVAAAKKMLDETSGEETKKPTRFVSPALKSMGALASVAAGSMNAFAGESDDDELSGTVTNFNQRVGRNLTGLQAIRMRAYGMQALLVSDVKAVLSLEAIYVKDLVVSEFSVDYNGSVETLLKEAGQLLGKDISSGSEDRPKLYNWLVYRFAPVFRNYYGTAKNAQPAGNLNNLESRLTGSEKVSVGSAVLGTIDGIGNSVWSNPSIFEIKGDLGELKVLADADLKHLQEQADKEVAGSPTQKSSDQVAGKNNAANGGSFTDKVMSTVKDTWDSAKETVSSTWNKVTDKVGDATAAAKIAVGMGPEYGGNGKASGGTIQSAGTGGKVTTGNGGKWEAIPYPASSGSIKDAYPTLKAISEMTGVPLDWLLAIVGLESGFRYTVKAGTSSATGWFQFINSTWDYMYKKAADKFGLPPDPGKTREMRNDPRINGLLGAEFTKNNYEGLRKGLGRDNLTDTDVYMAHFLGLGGALKFFRADPNMMAYQVFKKEYSANMPLFFVDGKPGKPRTIAELYQLFQKKIAKFWATTGKGYKSGGNEVTAGKDPQNAQTPGAVDNAQAVSDKQLTENLKADSKDGNGVAAQASPNAGPADPKDDITQDSANGGKGGAKPSITSTADSIKPMPGVPGMGNPTGSSLAPTSAAGGGAVNATGTESGGAAVDANLQAARDQASVQNTRRESEVRRDQKVAKDVDDIQNKQLSALYEIRDGIMGLSQMLSQAQKLPPSSEPDSLPKGNTMTRSNTIQQRAAANRPSSLTL